MAVDADVGSLTDDDVLEAELQQALKSAGEIELFLTVNKALRLRGELARIESLQLVISQMWEGVADFFEKITETPTIAGLADDHEMVVLHHAMRANFKAVAAINGCIKDGREAETELKAIDQMDHEIPEEDEL